MNDRSYEVTLIPGSGMGPRVTDIAREVIAATGVEIRWDVQACEGTDIEAAVASVRRTGVALKGKLVSTVTAGQLPTTVRFRKALGINTIVRHVRHLPGLPARAPGTDIVIVREASEDIYAGFEHESAEGVFESVKVTTRAACERIATYAFEYARANGRKRVTTVHKANILKKSDGMFLATAREVAARHPDVKSDDIIVDALCMRIVRRPSDFDVLLCGNLFGDIVSDCAAGMAGGVTVACGVGYGAGVAVFENPHGASGELVGADGCSPYPTLVSSADLLAHLGETDAAERIRRAVGHALETRVHTSDMGGKATAADVRAAVLGALR